MAAYERVHDLMAKAMGIAAVASLAIVPAAAAQERADTAQTPPAQTQPAAPQQEQESAAAQPQADDVVTSAAVTDDEVERFAKAYLEIRKVQDEAGDSAEARQQANEKMAEIVSDNDLTVDRYNQIARSLAQDQALLQRVQRKAAELQAETAGAADPTERPGASQPASPEAQPEGGDQ